MAWFKQIILDMLSLYINVPTADKHNLSNMCIHLVPTYAFNGILNIHVRHRKAVISEIAYYYSLPKVNTYI